MSMQIGMRECRRECTKDRTPGWMVYGGRIKYDGVPRIDVAKSRSKFFDPCAGAACVHETTPVHLNWEQCSQYHAGLMHPTAIKTMSHRLHSFLYVHTST